MLENNLIIKTNVQVQPRYEKSNSVQVYTDIVYGSIIL